MANIRKRGDKWQVQVRRLGFPNRSRSFNRHEEAKAWARAQELAMDRLEAGVGGLFADAVEGLPDADAGPDHHG